MYVYQMGRPTKNEQRLSPIEYLLLPSEEREQLIQKLDRNNTCFICMLQFTSPFSYKRHLASRICGYPCKICSFVAWSQRCFDEHDGMCRKWLIEDKMINDPQYIEDLLTRRIHILDDSCIKLITVVIEELDKFFDQKGIDISDKFANKPSAKYKYFLKYHNQSSLNQEVKHPCSECTLVFNSMEAVVAHEGECFGGLLEGTALLDYMSQSEEDCDFCVRLLEYPQGLDKRTLEIRRRMIEALKGMRGVLKHYDHIKFGNQPTETGNAKRFLRSKSARRRFTQNSGCYKPETVEFLKYQQHQLSLATLKEQQSENLEQDQLATSGKQDDVTDVVQDESQHKEIRGKSEDKTAIKESLREQPVKEETSGTQSSNEELNTTLSGTTIEKFDYKNYSKKTDLFELLQYEVFDEGDPLAEVCRDLQAEEFRFAMDLPQLLETKAHNSFYDNIMTKVNFDEITRKLNALGPLTPDQIFTFISNYCEDAWVKKANEKIRDKKYHKQLQNYLHKKAECDKITKEKDPNPDLKIRQAELVRDIIALSKELKNLRVANRCYIDERKDEQGFPIGIRDGHVFNVLSKLTNDNTSSMMNDFCAYGMSKDLCQASVNLIVKLYFNNGPDRIPFRVKDYKRMKIEYLRPDRTWATDMGGAMLGKLLCINLLRSLLITNMTCTQLALREERELEKSNLMSHYNISCGQHNLTLLRDSKFHLKVMRGLFSYLQNMDLNTAPSTNTISEVSSKPTECSNCTACPQCS
jgi:hypothetical protein